MVAILGWFCAIACVCGFGIGTDISRRIEHDAYARIAAHSKPLIEAIKGFEKELGHPPDNLDQLVPRFIAEIPSTGMGACPKFEYRVGEDAKQYDANPWILRIDPPQAGIGFDQFIYFPRQNYAERGYGGWLERIGDWAYVHE